MPASSSNRDYGQDGGFIILPRSCYGPVPFERRQKTKSVTESVTQKTQERLGFFGTLNPKSVTSTEKVLQRENLVLQRFAAFWGAFVTDVTDFFKNPTIENGKCNFLNYPPQTLLNVRDN